MPPVPGRRSAAIPNAWLAGLVEAGGVRELYDELPIGMCVAIPTHVD